MGFKDILDWLRANDMGDLAIKVAEMGIDDMDSLRATDITTFQEHGLANLSTRRIWESLHGPDILVIHETETATNRHDLPVVHARNRGSMKRALDRTITNDEDQLIIDLENDMYAQSSKKPREALWKTWCIMASAWNLPPVPLTEELILKVGASFKAGQYRSPQNYFSRAIQEHRSLTKANPSYFLQQLIKNTTRSIVRGMGPTPFKDSFEIELLCRICPYNLPTGQETWIEDPAAKIDATLICCWWLLRGIEAAAATTLHVWHQTTATEHTTFLTLPVQKTDSAGACVARGHSCICQSARHFHRICPHHAMKRHLDRMLRRFPAQFRLPQGMPLIPNASGHTISQDQLIQIFRDTIQLTGTTMERPGPAGDPRPRFSQHTCRVSGAQFLTRLGYSLEAVQLIGRWGSDAIKRYIQEAPLQLQHVANPRAPAPNEMTSQHLRTLVQREVQALQHQYWICNPMTKVCHVPAVPETCIDNARWVTLCGWNYGTSLYRKQMTKPTEHYCAKCKYLANIKEIDLDSEDDSWETLVRTGGGDSIVTYHMWLHRPWKRMHLILIEIPQTTLCEMGQFMMYHWHNHNLHRPSYSYPYYFIFDVSRFPSQTRR